MKNVKKIFVFACLAFAALMVLETFKFRLSHVSLDPGLWVLIWVSLFLNLGVILYHYSIPAHPKFLILPQRKWTLRFHIWSGTIELVSGFLACVFYSPKAALIQGLAGLLIHVPTALLQTPIVFGSKAIMVPSYLLCIFIHAYCAFNLIINPDSHSWAISTFLIFNIYAWCRFFFYFFDRFHLFGDQKYSTSILFAGLTIIPSLFGPLSMLLLVGYIGLYFLLVKMLFIRSHESYLSFVHERRRDSVLSSDLVLSRVTPEDILSLKYESERDKADFVFKLLSGGKSHLEHERFSQLLTEWGLSKSEVLRYLNHLGKFNIDFDVFHYKLASVWRYIYFEVLRTLNSDGPNEMIGRSLEGIRSEREVKIVKNAIQESLLRKVSFFSDASDKLIEDLASSLTLRKYSSGEIVFSVGDVGDRFYLIKEGSVCVIKGGKKVAKLTSGDCFGEMALVDLSPRNASVVTEGRTEFYTLSKSSFEYVLSHHVDVRTQLEELILSRR
jgi:Cyclic nucleotide-binding domain